MKTLMSLLTLGVCLLTQSCNDYLDVKSNAALALPNTLENLQMLLDDGNSMNYSTNSFGEASADDYFLLENSYNSMVEYARDTYIWEHKVYYFDNDWAAGYVPVYTANVVLDHLSEIEKTKENTIEWNNIRGNALFFRSHALLNQLWTYAKAFHPTNSKTDLGIVLRLTSDPSEKSVRSSVYDCYQQITSDLKESVSLLKSDVSDNLFRPCKAAAFGLLARTYHSMNEFEKAKLYADSALFLKSDLLDYNDSNEVKMGTNFPFERFNKETIFYTQLRTYQPSLGSNVALMDSSLYASYEIGDLRQDAFFILTSSGYHRFRGSYSASNNYFTGLTTAEMVFIQAESLLRIGQLAKGLDVLNELLKYRFSTRYFSPVYSTDEEEALKILLSHRRKELTMRGLRWMDIKRQNVLGAKINIERKIGGNNYLLNADDSRFALSIPQDIIESTGMHQN